MTTLKEHQAAMVNLLASGSGIPASASRLAHALHDVLALITTQPVADVAHTERRGDATTPGLNDKLLALDVEAVRPTHAGPTPRIKQLENTIRQLKGRVADLSAENSAYRSKVIALQELLDGAQRMQRMAEREVINGMASKANQSHVAHVNFDVPKKEATQAGCRKEDTQECEHDWLDMPGFYIRPGHPSNVKPCNYCTKCGVKQ